MANRQVEHFLRSLFQLLNIENIEYCVLRNYSTLPQEIIGTDIDFLVLSQHHQPFIKIVNKVAVLHEFKVWGVYEKSYKITHLKLLSQDYNEIIRLDLMIAVGALFYKFYDAYEILEHKKYNGVLFTPKLEHEINSIILQNWVSVRGNLKKKYIDIIKNLDSEDRDRLHESLRKIVGKYFSNRLFSYLDCEIEEMNKFISRSRLMCMIYLTIRHPLTVVLDFFHFFRLSVIRIFKVKGVFVVFLGPDGSGKSSIVQGVKNLMLKGYPKILTEHLYPKLFPRLKDLKQLLVRKNKNEQIKSEWEIRNEKKGLLKSFLTIAYYSFNYFLGYYFIILPKLVKGELVLFDRYFHDYLYDQKSKGIELPQKLVKMFMLFIPKPHKIIFLSIDPIVLIERKNEIPIQEVERQIIEFSKFKHNFSNLYEIDNSGNIEDTVKESIKCIIGLNNNA